MNGKDKTMTENACEECYSNMFSSDPPPEDCEGLVADKCISRTDLGKEPLDPDSLVIDDGFYIQVCPRRSRLGNPNGEVTFCGNGPDVIVMFRDTVPTREEYLDAARQFDT